MDIRSLDGCNRIGRWSTSADKLHCFFRVIGSCTNDSSRLKTCLLQCPGESASDLAASDP
jgi:hypothetical protein